MDKPNFDFVGIGDTVVDAFIRLNIGHVQESAKGAELCLPYGTKMPYESATVIYAVGNSTNATVSASRLGLKTGLVTFLGDDRHGEGCLDSLKKEKISLDFIKLESEKKTNYHYVLWYGEDRTILIKHTEFNRTMPEIGSPKWVYLSSMGQETLPFHKDIIKYLKDHPEIKLAFQPGTYQLGFGKEILDIYKLSEVICVNKEEAQKILATEESDIKKLMDGLQDWCPKIIIVTDGPKGAYMKYENEYFNLPPYPDIKPPYERTGAGDAFFSTFISFMAKGMDPKDAILRAPINSMNVVQHVGAQEGLLTPEKIEEYITNAPENYKLTSI